MEILSEIKIKTKEIIAFFFSFENLFSWQKLMYDVDDWYIVLLNKSS